jgi:hypothetical protein
LFLDCGCVSVDDLKESIRLAKKGGVASGQVILAICMSREPRPYGRVEFVQHCGSIGTTRPCFDVLYDRSKLPLVRRLERLLDERLAKAPGDSPLRESLEAQKRSVEKWYHATND